MRWHRLYEADTNATPRQLGARFAVAAVSRLKSVRHEVQ